MAFSDFFVCVDETGSADLANVDPAFPVFGLAFCVFRKDHYVRDVVPHVEALKFKYFGHDRVILHEYEIRRRRAPFRFGQDDLGAELMADLDELISGLHVQIVAVVVDKRLVPSELAPWIDGYGLAVGRGLQGVAQLIRSAEGRAAKSEVVHVLAEARGKREDRLAHEAFARIRRDKEEAGLTDLDFKLLVAEKGWNSSGMQIADLVAHPIARHYLNRDQPNRAWETIRLKLGMGSEPNGLIVLPSAKEEAPAAAGAS